MKTGETVLVRTALPEDAEQVTEIVRSVIEEGEFVVSTPDDFLFTVEQEREWIQAHLDDSGKLMLVAEVLGKVLGMLNFQNGARKRLAHQGMFGMSVHGSWRDKGVGEALILSLLSWASDNLLIEKVGLEVFATNRRAIHLYSKLGFAEEGRRFKQVKISDEEYVDLILMHRFVEEVTRK